MPAALSWRKMVGPSIMLAGLALGSGEFILWPYLTYKAGFIFFWACVLGVVTQYFINMEVERWTLATGESAITGFCRLSPHWAWVMLLLNILPWAWPAWATGAGQMVSWLFLGPEVTEVAGKVSYTAKYVPHLGIAGLFLVGIVLTAGPVVYNTVEKIQVFLVGLILFLVLVISAIVIRPDAVVAMAKGTVNIGEMPDLDATGLAFLTLMGALAFAGAGGSTNLGQSNFIKDKGYGMGRYIGRITSPLTGQDEAISDVGFHFHHTPENMSRWRAWWKAANIEHFFSFFVTCLACLCLMSLISYSLFYDSSGVLKPGMDRFGDGMDFVWGQATVLEGMTGGGVLKVVFLVMGIAILMTTELGVLDATARISTDIVKVNYLRDSEYWSSSRLYFWFLWGEILLGSAILLAGAWVPQFTKPQFLLVTTAAMNGWVMFLYSLVLLYMNNKILPRKLTMSPLRFLAMVWACAFFGYFVFEALRGEVLPAVLDAWTGSSGK
jgi:hypothetical protein